MNKDIMRMNAHPLSKDKIIEINKIKNIGNDFWNLLDQLSGNREISIAKTKIEESVMWAVKGITS